MKMLSNVQFETMARLQDELNTLINPEWKTDGQDWHLAAAMEGAEAIDHHGWKWWKKQEPNIEMAKGELIDIWHFIISYAVETETTEMLLHELSFLCMGIEVQGASIPQSSFVYNIRQFCAFAFSKQSFGLDRLVYCMIALEMTFEEVYFQYVCKNILNIFRQHHGYKEGTYIKMWDGEEDNHHLNIIANEFKQQIESQSFSGLLYDSLAFRYNLVLADKN